MSSCSSARFPWGFDVTHTPSASLGIFGRLTASLVVASGPSQHRHAHLLVYKSDKSGSTLFTYEANRPQWSTFVKELYFLAANEVPELKTQLLKQNPAAAIRRVHQAYYPSAGICRCCNTTDLPTNPYPKCDHACFASVVHDPPSLAPRNEKCSVVGGHAIFPTWLLPTWNRQSQHGAAPGGTPIPAVEREALRSAFEPVATGANGHAACVIVTAHVRANHVKHAYSMWRVGAGERELGLPGHAGGESTKAALWVDPGWLLQESRKLRGMMTRHMREAQLTAAALPGSALLVLLYEDMERDIEGSMAALWALAGQGASAGRRMYRAAPKKRAPEELRAGIANFDEVAQYFAANDSCLHSMLFDGPEVW